MRRINQHLVLLAIAVFGIDCANATTVLSCNLVSLAQADKAVVDDLAKTLVAPQLLDESKNVYCKRGDITVALLQTVPVIAADGAFETAFATCRRNRFWTCDLSRERAIDMVEAGRSETVRITTRDDLSADKLRGRYAAALDFAGNESTREVPECGTPADLAQEYRASFIQAHSGTVRISTDGTLIKVERDHIEIELSIEYERGVKAIHYRCIVRWPSG